VQRYDTSAGKWLPGTLIYELDADTTSVTDMSLIEGNRFVVIERDDLQGDAARAKRVYSIDLDQRVPASPAEEAGHRPAGHRQRARPRADASRRAVSLSVPDDRVHPGPRSQTRRHRERQQLPGDGWRGAHVKDATEWIWLELANAL
jgi:glycerophosphoryl diester phosphodiesterase